MPGTENVLGDYTAAEVVAMSTEDLTRAKQQGFRKPVAGPLEASAAAAGVNLGSSVPARDAQPESAGNVWGRNKKRGEEFTCPSGQRCRLRPLQLEELVMEGILGQVTRLEGLAQVLINKAEGLPPEKQTMPSREDFISLLTLVNKIVPMAVAEPRVYPDDYTQPVPEDAIMVSDIELMDRVAILDKALSGLKGLDNFRHPR